MQCDIKIINFNYLIDDRHNHDMNQRSHTVKKKLHFIIREQN